MENQGGLKRVYEMMAQGIMSDDERFNHVMDDLRKARAVGNNLQSRMNDTEVTLEALRTERDKQLGTAGTLEAMLVRWLPDVNVKPQTVAEPAKEEAAS